MYIYIYWRPHLFHALDPHGSRNILNLGNIRSAHLLEKTCFLICRHFQWQLGFTFGRLLKFPGQDEAGAENNKVTLNYRLYRELPAWKQKPTRRMQSLENQNDYSTSCHSLHDLRIVEYRQIYAYHKKKFIVLTNAQPTPEPLQLSNQT